MPASLQNKPSLSGSDYSGPAAIYIHWPFCERKCPYCDFNSHVRDTIDQNAWKNAYLREIETFAQLYPNIQVGSVFFGGGTPSLMNPDTTVALIEALKTHWHMPEGTEITLEANPSSVEIGRFKGYRDAGVNRLSVGIQSFKDEALKFLGRLHSATEAKDALNVAQTTFERVTFDLIYALPGQTVSDWQAELTDALTIGTSHMSLYQLTIEEGTAFHSQYARGKFTLPDEDTAASLFEVTQDIMEAAALPAYETSNHARPGLESRHNMAYWVGDPYIGIGPGAHGRLPGKQGSATAHMQLKRPEDWLTSVNETGIGLAEATPISAHDRAEEAIMTGLRLMKGIRLAEWSQKFGIELDDIVDTKIAQALVEDGFLEFSHEKLALTRKGWPLLNHITHKLIA